MSDLADDLEQLRRELLALTERLERLSAQQTKSQMRDHPGWSVRLPSTHPAE